MGGLHSTFPIVIESSNTPISAYICFAALVYALSPPFNRELDWIIHWLSSLESKRVGERRDVQIQWIPLDWSEKDSGMEKMRWEQIYEHIWEKIKGNLRNWLSLNLQNLLQNLQPTIAREFTQHSIFGSNDLNFAGALLSHAIVVTMGLKNRIKVN